MILKNNKRIDGCSDTVPIGTLNPFLGSTAPYGYLLCQGQKVSKITYKELYEICGDTFGQSTDTEFYLPDLRGQTIAGYKEGDSTFGTLGGLIGSLTHLHSTGNHTLTYEEMPEHAHGLTQTYDVLRPGGGPGAIALSNWSGSSGNTSREGGSQPHNHGDTSSNSSLQPTIVLNWIVKAFQLMPNQSYVENNLESDSTINSLSAAKGKELNERFDRLAIVATTGSYSDLSDKPTIPTVINNITSTSTTNALSAAQGKALNDIVSKKGSFILLGKKDEPISWTETKTWCKMPFTVELEKEGSTIVSSTTKGDLTISSGINTIYISTCITYDTTIGGDNYLFARITKNGIPITKTITKMLRWGQLKLDAVTSVTTGDVIRVDVFKDAAGTCGFYDYTANFGAGSGNYILLEVLK